MRSKAMTEPTEEVDLLGMIRTEPMKTDRT